MAYLHQKHIICDYLNIISNFVHRLCAFCAAFNSLFASKVYNYNYVHIIINYVEMA